MEHKLRRGFAVVVITAAVAPGSISAMATPAACHTIAAPAERLACYDRVTARPPGSAAPPDAPAPELPPTAVPRAPAPPQTATPAATSTVPTPERARGLPASAAPTPERPPSAAITRLERTPLGRYRFHLANGEVWEQLESGRISVREGDLVDVRPAALAGWTLRATDQRSRSVRVRRIE